MIICKEIENLVPKVSAAEYQCEIHHKSGPCSSEIHAIRYVIILDHLVFVRIL